MLRSIIINWVIERLQEPSTAAGIAVEIFNDFHWTLNTDLKTNFVHLLVALFAFVAIVVKEKVPH